LTAVASRAAAAILAISASTLRTRIKPDQSPVTAADEASDAVIAEGLSRLLPGIPVVSEEAACHPAAIAPDASFALVDPLDGTREFLVGSDEYAINIALVVAGRLAAGFIAAPALGLIYRGVVGRGAEYLRLTAGAEPGQAAEAVPIHTRRRPVEGLVATVSRSHLEPATEAFVERLPISRLLPCGSALKFCRIADGTADIYPRLSPTREWDVAAGHAIVLAAGGALVAPDGTPMSYGQCQRDFRVPGFVAWGDPTAISAAG